MQDAAAFERIQFQISRLRWLGKPNLPVSEEQVAQQRKRTMMQWIVADLSVKVDGQQTLSEGSVGLCLSTQQVPQGNVIVANTQMQANSR